jgi:predicted RNA-binding protein with EMAP domain
MDIKEKIEEIVEKIKSDKDFASKFTSDPVKALESLTGIDLPEDQIEPLIAGIKTKLGADPSSIRGSIKKLF